MAVRVMAFASAKVDHHQTARPASQLVPGRVGSTQHSAIIAGPAESGLWNGATTGGFNSVIRLQTPLAVGAQVASEDPGMPSRACQRLEVTDGGLRGCN